MKSTIRMKRLLLAVWAIVSGGLISAQPTLNTPFPGATDLEAKILIAIGAVGGATSYDIELSHDGSFTGTEPDYFSQLTSTKRVAVFSDLRYGQTYQLRYRSNNSGYGFATITTKDDPVTWAKITNGTTLSTTDQIKPKFQFGCTGFIWQFDDDPGFGSIDLQDTTDPGVNQGQWDYNQSTSSLAAGTLYYVRVAGIHSGGTGPYSVDVRNFNTPGIDPPVLNTPAMGATNMPTTFVVGIGTAAGAATYDIEISLNGLFNDTPPDYQGQLSSNKRSFTIAGLQTGQTYTLRWRGNNTSYAQTTISTISNPTTNTIVANNTYLNATSTTIKLIRVQNAVSYRWQFDTTTSFTSTNLITSDIPDSVGGGHYPYVATNFKSGEQYYCRIAVNMGSGFGPYGDTRTFYSSLHMPYFLVPIDQEAEIEDSIRIESSHVNYQTGTQYQIAENPFWQNSTILTSDHILYTPGGWDNPVGTIESYGVDYSGLQEGITYYIRLRPTNANQTGKWSDAISFSYNPGGGGEKLGNFDYVSDETIAYPNPSDGAFTIITTSGDHNATITSSTGSTVYSGNFNGSMSSLELDLDPGVYILNLDGESTRLIIE